MSLELLREENVQLSAFDSSPLEYVPIDSDPLESDGFVVLSVVVIDASINIPLETQRHNNEQIASRSEKTTRKNETKREISFRFEFLLSAFDVFVQRRNRPQC